MKKRLHLLFGILFTGSIAIAQVSNQTHSAQTSGKVPGHRTCGVLDHESWLEQNDPGRQAQRAAFEQQTQAWIASHQNSISTQAIITIPVVVHVVYNTAAQNISAAQVQSQIDVLNEDFTRTNADASNTPSAFQGVSANVEFQFCLAQQDPSGNATTGIHRVSTATTSFSTNDNVKHTATGGTDAWNPARYFNIWVCPLGGGVLGYAEFPTATLSQTYGVVIGYNYFGRTGVLSPPYNLGRTATHEVGHCFNLFHIWGDDGTACSGSDLVADTPNQAGENYGCPTYPLTDGCTGTAPGVMFMNYMDYVDDACMNMFTNGQKTRVLAVINSTPYNALQTSTACIPPANAPPVALFSANSTAVCPATPVTFTDQSTVNTTTWSWTFPSGTPASSTLQNPPTVTWSTPGTYTVTLVASNLNGSSTYTMVITVLGVVLPPLVEGFEGTTFPPAGWTLYDAGNNGINWLRYNAGRNSSWSAKFDNFNYDVAGARDDIRTPKLNLSSAATCTLTFDVAHRRYSTNNATNDSLEVLVSTNCGVTWTQVYIKGGATLASVTGTQTTAFTPTNTQWRNETVSLNTYVGQPGLMIAFRNRGHYGNNIYIDNVNIATTTSTLPNGTFTASATTVCAGTALSFTDNSSNSPTSWTWTFPSGTPASATTQNVASVVWNTAGTYTVTHTATNGSGTGTTTQVITVNARPTVTTTTTGATICSGNSTTITAAGGTSYTWMPGSLTGTTVTVSPTGTTTYTVTGTNANGCTNTATRTITVNPSPTVTTTTTNATICSGNSTTITAAGGTSYTWMPGSLTGTTVTVSPTTTTTYTVTGTAANGCTNTATRTITVNPTPTVTTTATSTTICSGNSTTITANGATTYSWMPGSLTGTSVTVSPTTTTTYTVTGTSTGCSGTATRLITVNPSPTVTTTTTGATICSGNSTTITASGGTSYSWMPGSLTGTTVTVSPTTTTTYTVTGTAANGCTNTSTRTITVNPSPTVTVSATSTTLCSGNSTTLTASGATTYSWMPGSLTGTSVTVSPATTTTYTVTGTASGCTGTATQLITVNPSPTVATTTTGATICSGNSTTITASGGTSYSWMPGSLTGTTVTVSPTTTTTYTVTGTAANGCTNTATRTITVNPSPTVTASASSTSICTGNSVTLTGSGAPSYSWNPGSLTGTTVTVTPTVTTTYTVIGTAANGCTNSYTLTITVGGQPTVTATASPATICSGNSTTLTGNGATTYTWMPGSLSGTSVTVSPTTTTTYTVTGTVGAGCSNTGTVLVTVNPTPTVTTSATSTTICSGNSTTITANGATTYTWMPGSLTGTSVTVSPATTTTYTVTGTSSGCNGTATRLITVNPSPTVSVTASSMTICSGNNTTLTATGASSYTWMPGSLTGNSVTVSPATTTTYTVTGTAGNGCTNSGTLLVTVDPTPTVTITASSATICSGDFTTLTGNGATTYSWMPGSLSGNSVTVSPATTTTYTVTGTDASGCGSTSTSTITVNPTPSVTATASGNTICDGSNTTLTANGASSYTWMPGSLTGNSVTVSPTTSTTYTVTGTDANGCINSAVQTITVNPNPTISVTASSTTICSGGNITLTASGGSVYTWNPGNLSGAAVTVNPSSSTTYTVTGLDTNGCSNTATQTITVNAGPTVTASSSNATICAGSAVTLTGSGAITYNWMPGNLSGAVITDIPAASTSYTVTGTDTISGCSNTATVTVTVNDSPTVIATSSSSGVCTGNSVLLSASGAGGYVWMPGNFTGASVTDIPATTTTYTVTGTDMNGCTDVDTVTVNVYSQPVVFVSGNTVICPGDAVTLTGNGASSYVWQPGGQTTVTITDSPASTTTYTVTGTDTFGCFSSTSYTVTVNTPPATPSILVNGSTLSSSVTGASYQWYLNGNPIPGATGQSYNATQTGSYTVEVFDAAGCASAQSGPVVDPTGIAGANNGGNSLSVYPNPNDGHFILNVEVSQVDNYVLEIHNALGQIIYTEALDNFKGTYKKEIDLSVYARGVYTIRVKSASRESIIKTVTY